MLTDSTENDGEEALFITDPISDSCRVRIRSMDGLYRDSSDANFSISASQGYLALAQVSQPGTPVLAWNAGTKECPQTATAVFRLKNFGTENLVAFAPQLMGGSQFTLQSSCAAFFALSPGQMSACSVRVTYNPQAAGMQTDTIRIQTDAVNTAGGYLKIPLAGTQIRTLAAPQVVIQMNGTDARLHWPPVTLSTGGCAIATTAYLVFYSSQNDGTYEYHGFTTDTSYVHIRVAQFAPGMFYKAVTYAGALSAAAALPAGATEDEVRAQLELEGKFVPVMRAEGQ